MSAIGVFDSGVGGLTVAAALERRLPAESILYLGDTARLPYGTKSAATVSRYTRRNVSFLLERGVKAVVVACNTASALALPYLHPDEWGVPVCGVIEPGAEQAARASRGRVGVIATESTVHSGAYAEAIHRHGAGLEVRSVACPLFVSLVEEGWQDDPITAEVARRYLAPLREEGVDTLVLGCTHYPLLRPLLQETMGPGVALIDSAEAVAAEVAAVLGGLGLLAAERREESHFCFTDDNVRFQRLARAILGREDLSLELVDVS
ncbi:MAG: glutamate racemase [Acidobacteriota bacterium]|nr:glutamate racemase [Acidobacteriota bacterium]MDH3525280.1 glutamate racemase [Acidobacteriota bacterium]